MSLQDSHAAELLAIKGVGMVAVASSLVRLVTSGGSRIPAVDQVCCLNLRTNSSGEFKERRRSASEGAVDSAMHCTSHDSDSGDKRRVPFLTPAQFDPHTEPFDEDAVNHRAVWKAVESHFRVADKRR